MTGFFAAIAARAVGERSRLQPRRAQRFEHPDMSSAGIDASPTIIDARAMRAPPTPPEPGSASPAIAPTHQQPAAHRTGPHEPSPDPVPHLSLTEATPASPVEPPAQVLPPTSTDDLNRAREAVRDAADQAARLAADHPQNVREPRSPSRPRHTETSAQDGAPRQTTAARAAPATAPAAPDRPEALQQDPPAGTTAAAPEKPEPGPRVRSPIAPRRPARPPASRARPIDLAALLREQVFSALVERGSVPTGVTPVSAPASSLRTPRPATAAVRSEGVRIDQPAAESAPSGDVHVHIARVSVTQAPPPPAPRMSRSETVRRSVDHGAYLARRRERG